MNSFSNLLIGLTLLLYGLAIALGAVYPRWAGWVAVVSGAAFMFHGAVVTYEGFVPSIIKLVGILLLAVWGLITTVLMWCNGGRQLTARPESAPQK